eukprot:CAMPEP_0176237972 /NCGR_PEP_ID=MMETSP0121_2-20121125/28125_1 /TAXON_ID=160619 /ORGANISM="Kryptoperidinium foliaceum, Strain CCMP 1326" /LENGTH=240 /DNA_ID=CAMNT_0017577433 /DNA_START=70 /DNA_END=789 /DNA_ORIENTATION=+
MVVGTVGFRALICNLKARPIPALLRGSCALHVPVAVRTCVPGTRCASSGQAGGTPKKRDVTQEDIDKLKTTFARASIAARLLQSRLALPLAYPWNTAMFDEGDKGRAPGKDWKEEELQKGLANVTPLVVGMAKMAPVLKAAQALSHYQGGLQRHVAKDPAEEDDPDIRLDFIRPQRFRGQAKGRGPGSFVTKTGKGLGWDDVSTGITVDNPVKRFTIDPFEDTPKLSTMQGKEFVSKTKW